MQESNSHIEVIVLGSGTSHGVPMIGCHCHVCRSDDPKDRRMRSSVFVRCRHRDAEGSESAPSAKCPSGKETAILIDTSPELRLQCVANGIDMVDVVLFTHHHADHVVGLDDLRRFNWLKKALIVCHGSVHTLDRVRRMFPYAFATDDDYPSAKPELNLSPIEPSASAFEAGGVTVTPIPLMHGRLPVLGYRIGRFAYCTDCNFIPETSFDLLEDLDVLILDALRDSPHPTHFNVEEAVATAKRIAARQTYFTHIAHTLKHVDTNAVLPKGIALAHDGLRFAITTTNNTTTRR